MTITNNVDLSINDTYDYNSDEVFVSDVDTKDTDKLLTIRFDITSYLLVMLYFSYTYKLSLDIVIALYERFGKSALFFYKALICKKLINISDRQFLVIINNCKDLYRQILNKQININALDRKFRMFANWLVDNTLDIFREQVELRLSYFDLYKELSHGGEV